jgi:hypothetical protein
VRARDDKFLLSNRRFTGCECSIFSKNEGQILAQAEQGIHTTSEGRKGTGLVIILRVDKGGRVQNNSMPRLVGFCVGGMREVHAAFGAFLLGICVQGVMEESMVGGLGLDRTMQVDLIIGRSKQVVVKRNLRTSRREII